jgi:hypothetical protein
LKEVILLRKVLHLEIQFPRRGKEEIENWRKRTRHPSVPLRLFMHFLVLIEHKFYYLDLILSTYAPHRCLTDSFSVSVSLFAVLPQPDCL